MAAGFGAGSVSELFAMADANPMIYAMLDGALQAEGSSLEEFRRSWNMADAMLGGLTEKSLAALRAQLDAGAAEYEAGLRAYEEGYAAYDDACLQSAIQGAERSNGTMPGQPGMANLLMDYLLLFYHVFPQAAQRLMPRAYEDHGTIALSATARMEVDTIFANESPRTPDDDMAAYVRCFMALKRLWHI